MNILVSCLPDPPSLVSDQTIRNQMDFGDLNNKQLENPNYEGVPARNICTSCQNSLVHLFHHCLAKKDAQLPSFRHILDVTSESTSTSSAVNPPPAPPTFEKVAVPITSEKLYRTLSQQMQTKHVMSSGSKRPVSGDQHALVPVRSKNHHSKPHNHHHHGDSANEEEDDDDFDDEEKAFKYFSVCSKKDAAAAS